MIRHLPALLASITILSSCVAAFPIVTASIYTGVTEDFPRGGTLESSAQIVVARESTFMAGAKMVNIQLNDRTIARIPAGYYLAFFVKAGQVKIGLAAPNDPELKLSIDVNVEKGSQYFFEISNDDKKMFESELPFHFKQIDPLRGAKLVAETEDAAKMKTGN